MKRISAIRVASSLCALALLQPGVTSAAPGGLVVDGEQIADATLYDAAKKEGKLLLYATYEAHGMGQIVAKFQTDTGLAVDVIVYHRRRCSTGRRPSSQRIVWPLIMSTRRT